MFYESVSARCQRRDPREDPSSGHGRRGRKQRHIHGEFSLTLFPWMERLGSSFCSRWLLPSRCKALHFEKYNNAALVLGREPHGPFPQNRCAEGLAFSAP